MPFNPDRVINRELLQEKRMKAISESNVLKSPLRWILAGLGFGLFYWFLESARDALVFNNKSMAAHFFSPAPVTFWTRVLVICVIVLFGIYVQYIRKQLKNKAVDTAAEKTKSGLFKAAILFSLAYWILESLRDGMLSHRNVTFLDFLFPGTMELWMRLLAILVLFLFTLYIYALFKDHESMERSLWERSRLERCLSGVSSHFITLSPHEFHRGVTETLDLINTFAHSDHSYLYLFPNQEGGSPEVTEWPSVRGGVPFFKKSMLEGWRWWMGRLNRFETISISSRDELPAGAQTEKEDLHSGNIQSIIAVPLVFGNSLIGFLGCSSTGTHYWTDQVDSLLRMTSDIIAGAIKRKKAEETLRQSEERYRQLVENTSDLIYRLDEKACFSYVNQTAQKIIGFSQEELYGKPYLEFVHPAFRQKVESMVQAQFLGSEPSIHFEFQALTKSGKLLFLDQDMRRVSDNGHFEGLQAVARDITEQRQTEENMKTVNEQFKKVDRMKCNFLSRISHELRTPIAILREGVSLCLEGVAGPLTEQQTDLLTDSSCNIDRLNTLVSDLLEISKLESNGEKLNRSSVDFCGLVNGVMAKFSPQTGEKKLTVYAELPKAGIRMFLDVEKVTEVIENLYDNAVQFTEPGGHIGVKVVELKDEVVCSISDTGVGIAPENMENLFEKFEQFDRKDGPGYRGTGIGLAIAKGWISRHGGRIWADSQVGKGSAFHFSIPKTSFPKILIVDDEENIVGLITRFLAQDQYRFVVAYSGEECIEKAKEESPDLIILDMMLPQMSGYEVIGRLSQDIRTRGIPILAMTGYAVDQEQLGQVDENAAIPIIGKPFDQIRLKEKVNSILAK